MMTQMNQMNMKETMIEHRTVKSHSFGNLMPARNAKKEKLRKLDRLMMSVKLAYRLPRASIL